MPLLIYATFVSAGMMRKLMKDFHFGAYGGEKRLTTSSMASQEDDASKDGFDAGELSADFRLWAALIAMSLPLLISNNTFYFHI